MRLLLSCLKLTTFPVGAGEFRYSFSTVMTCLFGFFSLVAFRGRHLPKNLFSLPLRALSISFLILLANGRMELGEPGTGN